MLNAAKNATFMHAFIMYASIPNKYGPKLYNTLSYKLSGSTEYTQDDQHIVTSSGNLLFIPSGAIFSTKIIEPGEFAEIKFNSSVLPTPEIRLFSGFDSAKMEAAFRNAVDCHASKDLSAYFMCQVYLNQIFAMIADYSEPPKRSETSLVLLAPALNYLRDNIFSTSFSIAKMQSKTDLSDTHFRALFKDRFKTTPQKYVTSERIQLAKHLLTDHPSMPVYTVAESVGYSDAYYFSRIFKSETGITPSQYSIVVREMGHEKNNRII